jgi:ParB family chromosome partitioning protein
MTTAEKIAIDKDKAMPEKGSDKRRALGRGLDSLLPGRPRVVVSMPAATPGVEDNREPSVILADGQTLRTPSADEVIQIPLDEIDENPYQTRQRFEEDELEELAQSIRTNGLIQPIVVRPGVSGRYILVIGERRCLASKLAGIGTVPAIVRTVSEQQAAEMTIVENLLRRDLNCLEQANAFARLSRDFGLTQEQIGQRTGVARESVSNYMRILRLPESVQQHLAAGRLGFSEARILLQLSDPQQIERIAHDAARDQFTVAFLKQLVDNTILLNEGKHPEPPPPRPVDPNVRAAQSELEKILGVRVKIHDRKGKGRIIIQYSTLDDFDRVLEMLKGHI